MAKYVCSVCGYVHEGDQPPEACPICKAPAEKFTKQEEDRVKTGNTNITPPIHSLFTPYSRRMYIGCE